MTRLRSKASPAAQDFAGKMNRRRALRTVGAGMLIAPVGWSLPVEASTINPYFDVKDYGATGNGTTDDITAIQNAVNAAASAGGGIVFFPTGRYRVSATITISNTNNIILRGAGAASVIFMDSDTGTIIKIGSVNMDHNQTRNHKICDLTIDRSVASSVFAVGIKIEKARYTSVDNVSIHNQGIGLLIGDGLAPEGISCQNISVSNCDISSFSNFNINQFPDCCIRLGSCADIKLHNVFCEPTSIGIYLGGNSNGIQINECTVVSGFSFTYGIVFSGNGFARYVTGCVFENATQSQFLFDSGTRAFIDNCWLGAGDTNNAARRGILIQKDASKIVIANSRIGSQGIGAIYVVGGGPTSSQVTISANNIDDNCLNTQFPRDTIVVQNGTHINITNNIITGSTGSGINIFGSSDYIMCSGNDATSQGVSNTASGTHMNVSNNFT